jgi:hypothetical protein
MIAIAQKPNRNSRPQMLSEEDLSFGQLVQDRATKMLGTYKGIQAIKNRTGEVTLYLKVRWLGSNGPSRVRPQDVVVIDTQLKRRRRRS